MWPRLRGASPKPRELPTKKRLPLLRTAALFHDAGFITTYKGHEAESCRLAHEFLPRFDYEPRQIVLICGMIEATSHPPKAPKNKLEGKSWPMPTLTTSDGPTTSLSLTHSTAKCGRGIWCRMKKPGTRFRLNSWRITPYWTNYARTVRQPAKYYHLRKLKKKEEGPGWRTRKGMKGGEIKDFALTNPRFVFCL